MSFAENFKNARTEAGLTQQQVADAIGIDRTSVTHYEMGDSMPSSRNLIKLCEVLNITMNELFKA